MAIARDKFWMFGVRAHQDDIWFGSHKEFRDRKRSRITPAEGALMLDVPNMLMINCDGIPVPFSDDAYGYAESFCTMKNVFWGATGSGGFRVGNEEKFICELADKYPNIRGAFLDDFMLKVKDDPDAIEKAAALLKEIREGLDKANRPLEIYAVWYTYEKNPLDERIAQYIDGITLWTWNSKDLVNLEENYANIEKNFPNHKKLLGIYMFDFREGMPVTNELMEHQCEFGLRMLKEGRLDGMIFEANSTMGIGLPSEYWLREWVEKNKNTPIPD